MRILGLIIALSVAACAPKYTWEQPGLDSATADQQREIDTAECNVAAMRAVPNPQAPALPPAPAPQSYSVSGTTTTYDANGNVHTGYYSGTASSGMSPVDTNRSYIEGAAAAQFTRESYESNAARRKFADACMLERGWQKAEAGGPTQTIAPRTDQGQMTSSEAAPTTTKSEDNLSAAHEQAYQRYSDWRK